MAQLSTARNPFLLMLDPEAVLAAVEKSERLRQLNRHLCRPLDRQGATVAANPQAGDGAALGEDEGVGDE
jgi:hypothetical protein